MTGTKRDKSKGTARRARTVLITGGAGFIGSHLCDHYIERGYRVMAVDNLITGSTQNIKHLFKDKNFSFLKVDISKTVHVAGPVSVILNFASPASPVDYLKYPIPTLKVGSFGTYNALELARAKKSIFLMASTSEVYGDPLEDPQKESYWGHVNPIGPRSVYDEAKRFSESLISSYNREYRVNTKIVRIFNTYGDRMRLEDGRVIPNFITQALKGNPLTVYGSGSQTRSYCYVDDLVKGIVKTAASKEHEPINLGNPNPRSVLSLAKLIIQLTDSKSRIVHKALPVDDPKQRCPDINRAKAALRWKPTVPLNEGLVKTIAYFKNQLS